MKKGLVVPQSFEFPLTPEITSAFNATRSFFKDEVQTILNSLPLHDIITPQNFITDILYGWSSNDHPLWFYFISQYGTQTDFTEVWSARLDFQHGSGYETLLYPISHTIPATVSFRSQHLIDFIPN